MIKIHADDYGISENINNHILKTIDEGYVNSVSVVVNNLSKNEAKKISKRNIDLHLHLCLTENKSLSLNGNMDSLISKKGILKNNIFFFLIFYNFLNKNKKEKINYLLEKEIQEQINKFKEVFNLRKIKIDGHQHVHLNNYVFQFLINHPDVEEIRLPIDRYKINFKIKYVRFSILNNLIKRFLINMCLKNKRLLINNSTKFPIKFFFGILFSGIMNKKTLHEIIDEIYINKDNAMILFHPGYSEKNEIIKNLSLKQSKYYKSPKRLDENEACMDKILSKLF